MTGRPGGAPFRFWSAARSAVEVSAQKARRREQPIARLLAPSLTRLTQDSCRATTSELTQDSWTHYRTLHPGRRTTADREQRACHRVRSCRRTECGRCSRESTRKRVMHMCALRTRKPRQPAAKTAGACACDARNPRKPLRDRSDPSTLVAPGCQGLWWHRERVLVARLIHRSAARPSFRTLERKTACDADRSASHVVLGLTWTRLDSLSLSRAIPLDSLGTHLDSGLTRTTHLRGIASRQVGKSNVRAKSRLFCSRTQTGRELRSTVMRVLRAACSRSGSGHIAALRLR